jgi:hypothetical protein
MSIQEQATTSPQSIPITSDGCRSVLCERCGQRIAHTYRMFRNRKLRVCDDCAKLADRVH